MAPEVVKQTGHTKKADIWSVGCIIVEMLTGEHPWAQLTQMQAIFKVRYRIPIWVPYVVSLPLPLDRLFRETRDPQRCVSGGAGLFATHL